MPVHPRRRGIRPLAHLMAVTALLSVTAGTAEHSTGSGVDTPATGSTRRLATSVDATRPLSERDKDVLHEAEQLLTQSCMSERGFRTWVVPRVPIPEDRDFPYVVDDVLWARAHGYGSEMAGRRDQYRRSDPNRRYFEGLSPQEKGRAADALHGRRGGRQLRVTVPSGLTFARLTDGCTAQAQQELYRDLPRWFRASTITDALAETNRAEVFTEKEFKESVKDWSACMTERGFSYATPAESRRRFDTPAGPAARRAEIRTAVAEAGCAASSGLADTAHRLAQRYDDHLRARYAGEFATRQRLEQAALPRAQAIVTAG
ncbi:hypothetical protein Sru01_08120 [Sphaerisporangium rufum]|uniref:Secreted protein n=1 Tax=Sphaerisporangium rufum TaxID=1381558 RepID=A0A919R2E3_9ACTN|nr:hypothetical protein [Sphaerisporangium rufum]GII75830.1 hypothetical protein Sru01_08120 [Sphaerisporangium rufum]